MTLRAVTYLLTYLLTHLLTHSLTCLLRFDGLHFALLDARHGSRLEDPPHGHASKRALARVPGELITLMSSLEADHQMTMLRVNLGQGLPQHLAWISRQVRGARGLEALEFVRTESTHASLLAEVEEQGVVDMAERHDAASRLGERRERERLGDPTAAIDDLMAAMTGAMGQHIMQPH